MKVHGADADYLLVDQNVCFKLPDEIDFEDGAIIACAGGTAYHALRKADVRDGQFVLVAGLGPVGLCTVFLAHAMGAFVIGSDPVLYRRNLALSHGAAWVIDPKTESLAQKVKEITAEGAEIVIETSGNDDARIEVVDSTSYHARIVYVGFGGKARNAILGPMLGDRRLMGSNMFTEPDYHELTRFMVRKGRHFSDLVTHRFPITKAQEAFDLFAGRETGKVMFVWD